MYDILALEVYLDILFILNFVMDYFIFWMVSKIIYQKVSKKRLLCGSLVGGVLYCLIVVIPFLRTINITIYLIILPLLPIKIIFKPVNLKQWVQTFIISNVTALMVGGMSYGIFYWIQEQDVLSNVYKKPHVNFSIGILFWSILGSYIVIKISRYYIQKRNTGIQKLYQLTIVYGGKQVEMEALLDTGNKVYDPITKHPVIIAEYRLLKELLPEEIKKGLVV